MNLYSSLKRLGEQNKPIRVGLIGAGKFGSMFLAQAARLPGIHICRNRSFESQYRPIESRSSWLAV